jgi:hypothetical protein
MIQMLPIFTPVLAVLGAIRFSVGPRERPLLSESWAQMVIAGIVLILAVWLMFFVGLK